MTRSTAARLAIAALATSAWGCGDQSPMNPAGPAAFTISRLGWFVLILFSITVVVMWVLIAWLGMRRRGTLAEHAPADAESGSAMNWVLIGGFAIPTVTFAVILITMLRVMGGFPMAMEHDHDDGSLQLAVVGHQWWFEVRYLTGGLDQNVTTATEIHIPIGRPVDVSLQTSDVIHSFWVPQLHGKVDLMPGMVNHIRIQADKAGSYRGECAEYCGEEHARMVLHVIAEPQAVFDRWLENQRKAAVTPADDMTTHGQQLFMTRACVLCHTIRGTRAGGTIGPDLTHLASRQTIAGGWLPNNIANLHAWVTHAQSLKPGAEMPDLAEFSGEELHDLVSYLQSLH